jgi:hypothetical protein
MKSKYSPKDIIRAMQRQKHWAQDALDEAYASLERAKREKKEGLELCYLDSMQDVKACIYWAKKRKNLSNEYKKLL